MVKRPFLLMILFVFIFLACGCTLIKGTGGAAVGCAQGAAQGASAGFKDDANFLKKADDWTRANLW